MMRLRVGCICLCWVLGCAAALAGPPAASWTGLVGLYTSPTAESFAKGEGALTFAELRFPQDNGEIEELNMWITGGLTVVPADRWEISVMLRNETVDYRPVDQVDSFQVSSKRNWYGNLKYVITPPAPRKTGWAIGLIDVSNETDHVDGLETNRGRRLFVVGSYEWLHMGATYDNDGIGVYAGVRLSMSDNVELIAEYTTQPLFAQLDPEPSNIANFNVGIRLYPRELPNFRADLAAIGDGSFDFGFSGSYRFSF